MPKIQGVTNGNNNIYVSIPKDHAELLGWKKGDLLIAESNKRNDSITFKRVRKDD